MKETVTIKKATENFLHVMWRKAKRRRHRSEAEERKKLKEMLLSIRNGSQTMHFHNHYASRFMSAVRTKNTVFIFGTVSNQQQKA